MVLTVKEFENKLIRLYFSVFTVFLFFLCLYFFRCCSGIDFSFSGVLALYFGVFSSFYIFYYKKYITGNIFIVTWELAFFFSLFKLSNRQFFFNEEICFYIFLIGLVPFFLEKILFKNKNGKFLLDDSKLFFSVTLAYLFMLLSIVFFVLIYKKYGIFATNGERVAINDEGSWMNVACVVFTRICFYISSYYYIRTKRYITIFAMVWCVVYCFLVMTRSLLISFAIFFLIQLVIESKLKLFRCLLSILFVFLLFGFLGNLREGNDFSIVDYTGVEGNSFFVWLYSYVCVNFDNLALQIISGYPTYTLSFFLRPFITLFDFDFCWYDTSYLYVGHLNLGTFYRDYVCDFGEYAIFLFIVTISILLFIIYSKKRGCYVSIAKYVVLSELALSPLTNHFTQSSVWIVIFLFYFLQYILNFFINSEKKALLYQ